MLQEGAIIGERFELLRPLRQGGMGSVWVALQRGLRRQVAIKFVRDTDTAREDLLARFEREATIVSQINSSHVVKVHDFGFDGGTGLPYLAMELLVGESLEERLQRTRVLPLSLLVEVVGQVCRGLHKAHKLGIVHRDIKPENIFLCHDDDDDVLVKLLDFGVAKGVGPSLSQTRSGGLVGTPLYMSPEQALGTKAVGPSSDLYSLAVVAYRCLTGAPPFESEGLGDLLMMVTSKEAPTLGSRGIEAPAGVEAWLRRGLDKSPEGRFCSAREMAEALRSVCAEPYDLMPSWSEISASFARKDFLRHIEPAPKAASDLHTQPTLLEASPLRPRPEPPEGDERIDVFSREHISSESLRALSLDALSRPSAERTADAPAPRSSSQPGWEVEGQGRTGPSPPPPSLPEAPAPSRSRGPVLMLTAALVLAGVVGGVVSGRSSPQPASASAPPTEAPGPSPAASASASASASGRPAASPR